MEPDEPNLTANVNHSPMINYADPPEETEDIDATPSPVFTDSSANTTIFGNNWHVISEAIDRKKQTHGCLSNFQSNGYPIVNAVAKIEIDGEPKLIQINEGAYIGQGHSLFCNSQLGHFGIHVDDNLFFGEMIIKTKPLYGFNIPLQAENALSCFYIQKPTREDLAHLEIFELTADLPWDPQNLPSINNYQGRIKMDVTPEQLARRFGTHNVARVKAGRPSVSIETPRGRTPCRRRSSIHTFRATR